MVGTRPPQGDAELADGPGTASAARHLLRGSGLARPLLEAWKVRHRNIQSSREEKSGNHGFHMNSGGFPAHFPSTNSEKHDQHGYVIPGCFCFFGLK
jgi:hypothetical protein